ncbi:RNA-directed DNA polymerase, eukaryota [Tanacetum coccineum]
MASERQALWCVGEQTASSTSDSAKALAVTPIALSEKVIKFLSNVSVKPLSTRLDDQPLSTRFPRLFRLENDQNCLVRHRWINGHWWWDWRRDVRGGSEYQQLQMLTQAVSHVALREGQDRLWWDIDIEANEVWKRVYNWCQVDVRDINDLCEWFDCNDRNYNVRDRKVKIEVIALYAACERVCQWHSTHLDFTSAVSGWGSYGSDVASISVFVSLEASQVKVCEGSSRPFGKQQRRLRLGSSIAHTLSEEVETPADLGKKRRKQTKSNGLRVKKMRISDGSSFRQNIGTVQEADLIKMERRGKRRVKAMTFPSLGRKYQIHYHIYLGDVPKVPVLYKMTTEGSSIIQDDVSASGSALSKRHYFYSHGDSENTLTLGNDDPSAGNFSGALSYGPRKHIRNPALIENDSHASKSTSSKRQHVCIGHRSENPFVVTNTPTPTSSSSGTLADTSPTHVDCTDTTELPAYREHGLDQLQHLSLALMINVDTKSAMSVMLGELKKLIEAAPLFHGKLNFSTLNNSRLQTLINQKFSHSRMVHGHEETSNDNSLLNFDPGKVVRAVNEVEEKDGKL